MSYDKVLLVMPSGRHGLGYAFDLITTGLEYLAAFIEDSVSQVHIIDLKMEKNRKTKISLRVWKISMVTHGNGTENSQSAP